MGKYYVGSVAVGLIALFLGLFIVMSWVNHVTYCKWGVPTTPVEVYAKQEVCN